MSKNKQVAGLYAKSATERGLPADMVVKRKAAWLRSRKMNDRKERQFNDVPAVRSAVPLLVGLTGPSGSGKTFSALRIGTGIQKIVGGEVFGIDTEANRMLHYADKFKFRHIPFLAPFDPLSYLDALKHCLKKGAKTVIIDSTSHIHEGPGGTLEEHSE